MYLSGKVECCRIMDASAVVSLGFGVESLQHYMMLLTWRLVVSGLDIYDITTRCFAVKCKPEPTTKHKTPWINCTLLHFTFPSSKPPNAAHSNHNACSCGMNLNANYVLCIYAGEAHYLAPGEGADIGHSWHTLFQRRTWQSHPPGTNPHGTPPAKCKPEPTTDHLLSSERRELVNSFGTRPAVVDMSPTTKTQDV